ncbi:hypothetical protein pb186bvf_014284 [Paramecium bursaria]
MICETNLHSSLVSPQISLNKLFLKHQSLIKFESNVINEISIKLSIIALSDQTCLVIIGVNKQIPTSQTKKQILCYFHFQFNKII